MTNIPKHIYRTLRALVFAAIIAVVALYLIIYVLVTMPAAQKRLVSYAEKELSSLLATDVRIGRLEIYPFNEVRISDIKIYEQRDRHSQSVVRECITIDHLGAGIDLVELLKGEVVISYAEITGLDAKINRRTPESPYNIAFIAEAFRPKEQKESENVRLQIHTVVIRKLSATYDLLWLPRKTESFDPNHISISNFRADISIPEIDTKPFGIEAKVRRIALIVDNSLDVKDFGFKLKLKQNEASIKDLSLKFPGSTLSLGDIELKYPSLDKLTDALLNTKHLATLQAEITPSDFSLFSPGLKELRGLWYLGVVSSVDRESMSDLSLGLVNKDLGFHLMAEGEIFSYMKPSELTGHIDITRLTVSPEASEMAKRYLPNMNPGIERIVNVVGNPSLDIKGSVSRKNIAGTWMFDVNGNLTTDAGNLEIEWKGLTGKEHGLEVSGSVATDRLEVGKLIGSETVGGAAFSSDFALNIKGKNIGGNIGLEIPFVETSTGLVEDVKADIGKKGNEVRVNAYSDSRLLRFDMDGRLNIDGEKSSAYLIADIASLPASLLGLKGKTAGTSLSGKINLEANGNRADNLTGSLNVSSFGLSRPDEKPLTLEQFVVTSELADSRRQINVRSDYLDADISGRFSFSGLVRNLKSLYASLMPAINPLAKNRTLTETINREGDVDLRMAIHPLGAVADYLNLPLCPLEDMTVEYSADFQNGTSTIDINAPYLRQGKSKLFAYNVISGKMTAPGQMTMNLSTETPAKSSDTRIDVSLGVTGDDAGLVVDFNPGRDAAFTGKFSMGLRAVNILSPEIILSLKSSEFKINDGKWNVENGDVLYRDKKLAVNNIRISHDDQFVKINGNASADPADILTVELADIDLSYIFEVLNINYVNFGGLASGRVECSELFTKSPKAQTVGLKATDFAYGGAELGDADLSGIFHSDETRIQIGARIKDPVTGRRRADASGDIWIGRDSLSFDFDADRLNASFVGQFMSAFASDLTATASGQCHLFGTFKNIDLRGKLKADSIRFRLDFTGVYYSGSDSLFLDPGKIRIPKFRIYDREGNSGYFSGELRHRFLRDSYLDFTLRDARGLLCYDLPKGPDDFWWGTVYASGGATIRGVPGLTEIDVDVSSENNSSFYFELSDSEAAREYNFLTFTDKTPRPPVPAGETKPNYLEMYRKKKVLVEEVPGDVHIDLRMNATPGILVTLVMDPVSGDKITARGYGPLQLQYETENDEPRLYGKYTITEGLYNFSLQDVILRDFRINEGSTISFNGDPMAAMLDIRAAYRVNTSLTDLDKSFAYDRDLNRTNVPVDAMLLVSGPLDAPDIGFDLEFPTLTEEVGRKVRSIVSTNDLMSRQIIYLLALNRFYTPEYMDTSGSGNELTSVASSTISSQLGNALSQLTDKLSVMPSIRSDKGDFSDLEMDVALSSRLLNNRLLINGNFGYRDRTTSTTTFVGDFDVQYLLDRKGNFRLKAYNHFNDQNYYLRQALTTQGIGLEYRHDFNRFMSFLRRKRKPEVPDSSASGAEELRIDGDSIDGVVPHSSGRQ